MTEKSESVAISECRNCGHFQRHIIFHHIKAVKGVKEGKTNSLQVLFSYFMVRDVKEAEFRLALFVNKNSVCKIKSSLETGGKDWVLG